MNVLRAVVTFIFINIVYTGLPLVSWGLDDVSGFFASPAREGYAMTGFALAVIAGVMVARRTASGDQRGNPAKRVRRQTVVLQLVRIVSIAMLLTMPWADRHAFSVLPGGEALRLVGLAAFLTGMAISIWATIVLGKNFSMHVTIQKDHTLVTEGPFHFIRNPRYLGILTFVLGGLLIFRSGIGLIGLAILFLLILFRIHDEERTLAREFGARWDAYVSRTTRLIPFIY